MKRIFFAIAALFGCAVMSHAQTNFVATLQHEGELTHFYGTPSLAAAYNAATDGDIITLSAGTFTSPGTITKAITLRGVGIGTAESTRISTATNFQPNDSTKVIIVEGITFNTTTNVVNDASSSGQGTIRFIKSQFNGLYTTNATSYSTVKGPAVRMYNCRSTGSFSLSESYPDFKLYNCFIGSISNSGNSLSAATFVNCVITYVYSDSKNMNFYNCIFFCNTYSGRLHYSSTCQNCLGVGYTSVFNDIISGGNNKTASSAASVFATFTTQTSNPSYLETFELTEAAKETYIGTDGTQIGMQGGSYPFSTTVQYPIVTTFNVDAQTNKQGILNVEVDVDEK
ncbi:MAG: hypothetical protein IJS89_02160 [Bacteroidaceae bacterium]|nr:hypothetical protein [Bacteroidaceae bacterium]